MTPIRSSKLSPSVESLRSFRPRPTETSSGSATSHSIVNAIWSSASSICSSTSAPSPHVTTSLREISSPGCSWLPLQSSLTEYRPYIPLIAPDVIAFFAVSVGRIEHEEMRLPIVVQLLAYLPTAFDGLLWRSFFRKKRRHTRACIQLGGVCQGTEQNQTRNTVL